MSYSEELNELNDLAEGMVYDFTLDRYYKLLNLAISFYEQDKTSIDHGEWDDLSPEAQAHYTRIALLYTTRIDISVGKEYVQ